MKSSHVPPASVSSSELRGILRVIASNRKTAFVTVEALNIDVLIPNEYLRNRAIHGDIVQLEILPSSEWTPLSDDSLVPPLGHSRTHDKHTTVSDDIIDDTAAQIAKVKLWQPRHEILHSNLPSYHSVKKTLHPISMEAAHLNMQPTAKVTNILEKRREKCLVGSLSIKCKLEHGMRLPDSQKFLLFQPIDTRYPFLRINRTYIPETVIANPMQAENIIFCADICDVWPENSESPLGENVRSIGEMGEIHAETEALLTALGLMHDTFSDDCIAPLKGIIGAAALTGDGSSWRIPVEEISRRRDLRGHRVFTIDPPSAKDLDDALHITRLGDDLFEIGVHIADVSHFLRPDTPLDTEAARRATSVYLVQKVVPMLPAILCEELCSLNPNVDRLAFSCIWKMHSDGMLSTEAPWFGKTIIRSCAKLDYPTAQRMIEGIIPSVPSEGTDPDAFLKTLSEDVWESGRRPVGHTAWQCAADVSMMAAIARKRRASRLSSGALVIESQKISFHLDANGNPDAFHTYLVRESNQLVEEYMLLANFLVAQELLCKLGPAAFLRNHTPPDMKQLNKVEAFCRSQNIPIDVSSAMTLQQTLNDARQTADPITLQVLSNLMSAPMKPAKYIVVDDTSEEERKHYALSIPYYTHFTSPIRRYADVVVHRLLEHTLIPDAAEISRSYIFKIKDVAEHCNLMKMKSEEAQEKSDNLFLSLYLLAHPSMEEAVVMSIGSNSFTILIPRLCGSYRLYVNRMPSIESTFDSETKVLQLQNLAFHEGKSSGAYQFDQIQIYLMRKIVVMLTNSRPKSSFDIDLVKGL